MKSFLLYLAIFLFMFSGCKTTNKTFVVTPASQKVAELVASKRFSIECNKAYPTPTMALQSVANAGLIPPGNSVSQINITGNQNYFKIFNDSISVSLPYFGEHRLGGMPYNSTNSGINFEGTPQEFNTKVNPKKNTQVFNITFKNNNTEQCQAVINIYPEGASDIIITSSHRTSIRYSGQLIALEL